MFTQECFLRNASMRDVRFMAEVGHERIHSYKWRNMENGILYFKDGYYELTHKEKFPNAIDCGTNKKLFQELVTGLWLTNGEKWRKICYEKSVVDALAKMCIVGCLLEENWHKVTVEELREHFKQ